MSQSHLSAQAADEVVKPLEQVRFVLLRDCVIRCREGDAVGYGIFESMVIGEHPRYGLTRETSFL